MSNDSEIRVGNLPSWMQCLPVCSVADLEKPNKCGGEVHQRSAHCSHGSSYANVQIRIRFSGYKIALILSFYIELVVRIGIVASNLLQAPLKRISDGVVQLCLAEPRDSVKG
jgi:hypothetical protein